MVSSISLIVLFAIFGVLAYQTARLSGAAAEYPGSVLAVLIVLLVAIAAGEVRRRGKLRLDPELAEFWSGPVWGRVALAGFIAMWLAYPLLLNAIGFLCATALAVAAGLALLGERRPVAVVAGSIAFSLALAVLVKTVLYIPVPLAAPDLALERLIFSLRARG